MNRAAALSLLVLAACGTRPRRDDAATHPPETTVSAGAAAPALTASATSAPAIPPPSAPTLDSGAPPPQKNIMTDPAELDRRLRVLLTPSGDRQAWHYKEEALDWLFAHADAAHPRLVALAQVDEPPGVVLEALPRFARAESVPVLERALRHASGPTTVTAGQALALHPHPAVLAALTHALSDPRNQVVASAALGLVSRRDPAACLALRAAAAHPDAEVRDRIRQALTALGCP